MYNVVGLGIALVLAVAGFARARVRPGHYDGAVYGMRPAIHARYAAVGAAFFLFFLASFAWSAVPVVPLLAALVLIALLYATSFLRGAEADD